MQCNKRRMETVAEIRIGIGQAKRDISEWQ